MSDKSNPDFEDQRTVIPFGVRSPSSLEDRTRMLNALRNFDDNIIDVITEMCVDYSNEELLRLHDIIRSIARRSWIYEWALIATKAYQIRNRLERENKSRRINVSVELSRVFPNLSAITLRKKLRGWDFFYQDTSVTDRAKWNGVSYLMEVISSKSETWFIKAADLGSNREEAREYLEFAQNRFVERRSSGERYTISMFVADILKKKGKRNRLPRLAKMTGMVLEILDYLNYYSSQESYHPEVDDVIKTLCDDFRVLFVELMVLRGEKSLSDLEEAMKYTQSRIRNSPLFDASPDVLSDLEDGYLDASRYGRLSDTPKAIRALKFVPFDSKPGEYDEDGEEE